MLAKYAGSSLHSASCRLTMPPPRRRYCIEVGAILEADVAGVTFVDDQHVRRSASSRALGKCRPPSTIGAAVLENLAPVGEELRIVVLPLAVRLRAAVDVDLHRRHVRHRGRSAAAAALALRRRRAGWAPAGAPAGGAGGGCCASTVVNNAAAPTASRDTRILVTLIMTPHTPGLVPDLPGARTRGVRLA